ncbi:hypothetical protein J3E69DRAFT_322010 [Trichoderma sp. SZMC 28015]
MTEAARLVGFMCYNFFAILLDVGSSCQVLSFSHSGHPRQQPTPCLLDHLKLNIIIPSLARVGISISWPCANEYSRLVLSLSSVHSGVIWVDDLYASPHTNLSIT